MARTWRRFVAFVAAVPLAVGGAASASIGEARTPAEAAWAYAVERDSLEAYAEFAMLYPESKFARAACAKLSSTGTVLIGGAAMLGAATIEEEDELSVSAPGFIPYSFMIV